MQGTTTYLLKTSAGCKRVTRRIGKRRKTVKRVGERLVAPIILITTVFAGLYAQTQVEVELIDPKPRINIVSQVQASEMQVEEKTSDGWEEFVKAVDKVAPIYGFPKNVVLAQGALESGRGTSRFSKERNNFLGIGAYDSDPNQAFHYENAEQCVIEYMRLIKRNFPEAWDNRDNPEKLLYHLKHNSDKKMYATDPNYISKVTSVPEWRTK